MPTTMSLAFNFIRNLCFLPSSQLSSLQENQRALAHSFTESLSCDSTCFFFFFLVSPSSSCSMADGGDPGLGWRGKRKPRAGELGNGLPSFPLLGGVARMAEGGGGGEVAAVEEELRDPLAVLGSEIVMLILSKIDARSVALARLVSREWLDVASNDWIWGPKCEQLWLGKAHIPQISEVSRLPKWVAYLMSIEDAKRTRILQGDLCNHIWEFHYTEVAPEYWRSLDPYWNGKTPMRRYFHPDGSISADPDDQLWGGHESCYTIVTSMLVGTDEDAQVKVREHYIRINKWPKLFVRRRVDWGWELYNHIYCYTSVPDSLSHA